MKHKHKFKETDDYIQQSILQQVFGLARRIKIFKCKCGELKVEKKLIKW